MYETDPRWQRAACFTGSVGLHLVVSELHRGGYRNDPTNDMVTFALEGLEPPHARELTRQLLESLADSGEIELKGELDEIAAAVAKETDGLPFYVNYCVDRLLDLDGPIELAHVTTAVDSLILDPEDTAHFGHYAERIEVYYLFDEHAAELAFLILKVLCRAREPMTEEELRDAMAVERAFENELLFSKILSLLVKDHYLERVLDGEQRCYRFKYDIVRRWWLRNRG